MDGFNARCVGEKEKKSIEKNIKAKLGGLKVWDGKKSFIKHHRSMNHRTNKPKRKNRMEEKSKCSVCPCPIFLLDDSLPNYTQWWTEFSSLFLSLFSLVVLLRERNGRGEMGMTEHGAFRPKKIWCSKGEEEEETKEREGWHELINCNIFFNGNTKW